VENSRIGRDVLDKGSRELDEPLSSFERGDDLGQPRVERRNNSARRVFPIRTQTMEGPPCNSWCTA
jgi:hypothetical protein